MKILVTGATGFIGSNIAKGLCERGHEVIGIGRNNEESLEGLNIKLIKLAFYEVNLKEIGRIDVLFHEAAIVDTALEDEAKMNYVNCNAAIDLFKGAIRQGCKKIIYASSTAVYGNSRAPFVEGKGEEPLNAYGRSKLNLDIEAMKLAKENPKTIIVGLRYCNVYGPGESHKGKMANMAYLLTKQIKENNPRLFNYGEQRRDQIYIKDVVRANLCAMTNAKKSCIVNCGFGKAISFLEMVDTLNKMLGEKKEVEFIGEPPASFQDHTACDMGLAEKLIGFVPKFDFLKGVKDYYKNGGLA